MNPRPGTPMRDEDHCPMPTPECYRDIGALGARLDEIEKARLEREAAAEKAPRERESRIDAQLDELNAKMDSINAERQTLIGVIWAIRIIFGAAGVTLFYLLSNGAPSWLKRAFQ
jgi:tetrahydromethanopterin S-methyltransferase subunit G